LKQTGYTLFVGFHGDKTYNTFVCGNTICSYMVFPQTKVLLQKPMIHGMGREKHAMIRQ
jgi:hypothetical protein